MVKQLVHTSVPEAIWDDVPLQDDQNSTSDGTNKASGFVKAAACTGTAEAYCTLHQPAITLIVSSLPQAVNANV